MRSHFLRAQQDDLSPPDMLVWGVAIPREHLQTAAISGLESDGNSGSHAPDSHAPSPLGIPLRDSNVRRYPLGHHYIFGEHKPGHTDIWAAYEKARAKLPKAGAARGIGTPEQLRAHLKSFEDSGVDQVAFIQQGGKNRHEHICQSLELFAREVLPEFDDREEARARRKQQELTPFLEQAMMRKEKMAPLAEDRIPSFVALGRQVAETEQLAPEQAAARRRMLA